ncbi:hypothetical protein Thivi_0010 [Thiocystis violascens DSM 198]|uniref:Uncharacterized protein n=1 Tax=Thiocystis violascens (strain ATCC 17096 / DSM 198 / 6111) TaxID=765911 RepID=I3Y534_THIV6|nr:hypothetical protein Thivi_0010 [Thiocystis violascens DSM 198]
MNQEMRQTSMCAVLCAILLLPLTAAQAQTIPYFAGAWSGSTAGTSNTASSTTATLILTCGLPGASSSNPSSTASGNCTCTETGSGSVSCSCASGTGNAPAVGTAGSFSFSASSNTPEALLDKVSAADNCAEAKALIESNSGRSGGACSMISADSLAPLLFVCDIVGESF